MELLNIKDSESLLMDIHNKLTSANIDYRFTGVVASNIYGFSLATNVIEIAVESDEIVVSVVRALGLPEKEDNDPYVYFLNDYYKNCHGVIKIQGDIMGEPFIVEEYGIKLHNKKLLLDRLAIYGVNDGRVLEASSFIAITLDDEKTEKYKEIWNRM